MRKQSFKGMELTFTKCVNSIIKIYNQATPEEKKNMWYDDARIFAMNQTTESVSHVKVAGIIAALSPLKSWEENKRITITFLQNGKTSHTKTNHQKAVDILNCDGKVETICDILNGNKVTAFFLNIVGYKNVVTIDRHALAVAIGRSITGNEGVGITKIQNEFFQRCYQIAARKENVDPSYMQAITWVAWKRLKQLKTE
jgi:hypothetical protein